MHFRHNSQPQREMSLINFRRNKINIVVTTDLYARGLDIKNLEHVWLVCWLFENNDSGQFATPCRFATYVQGRRQDFDSGAQDFKIHNSLKNARRKIAKFFKPFGSRFWVLQYKLLKINIVYEYSRNMLFSEV